ncbi:trans-sialidase [Trypanosoma cruzi]|nr:trans-sialidase [Trypanosoma cruzi]
MKWGKLVEWEDVSNAGGKYGSLRGPSLVEVQGHVFAISEADCRDGGNCSGASFTGVASKYLGLGGVAGPTDISTAGASNFGAYLLKEGSGGISTRNGITRPTTIVIEDSVYMLLGNYSRAEQQIQGKNERSPLLVKGTLTDEGGKKKIRWNETHAVEPQAIGDSYLLTEFVGGGGSGFMMNDGTPMFPMQANDKDGRRVLLSMRLIPSEKKWELSLETPGKGCRDPAIVGWE